MMPYLNECGIVCSLGDTHDAIKARMFERAESGVAMTDTWSAGRVLPLGCVTTELPSMAAWPVIHRSRNNQLALAALEKIRPAVDAVIARFGTERIGIVIGTSTSGVAATESALQQYAIDKTLPEEFHYAQQEMGSPAGMLAIELGISGRLMCIQVLVHPAQRQWPVPHVY